MTLAPDQLRTLLPRIASLGRDGAVLAGSLEAWLDGAELDQALGLALGWRQRDRLARRDALLRELAAGHYPGARRPRATAMAADLARYRGTGWRRERRLVELADDAPVKRRLMHAVFRLDPATPTGWRQLVRILEPELCHRGGVAVTQGLASQRDDHQHQDVAA